MILLLLAAVVVGYAGTASWSVRGGTVRLWTTALIVLAAVILGSAFLGMAFAVPDPARWLLYSISLLAPVVLVPTLVLAGTARPGADLTRTLSIALLGAVVGLACGFGVVVFLLGVW